MIVTSKKAITSTTKTISEILYQNDMPLLKMWNVDITSGVRPFTKHSHTRFEITLVNNGYGEYTTENEVYPIKTGDIFVFSSNETHSITKVSGDGLSITNLHFEPRYLIDNRYSDTSDDFINFCFSHSPDFKNRIPCNDADKLRNNYLMIKQELTEQNSNYEMAVRANLDLILIELLRNHKYKTDSMPINQNSIFNMLSVYNYIDEHISDELTLHNLSNIANLSPNYFSHIFKKLNGISLWDYITAKRIEKAIKLITDRNSNLTILEIALQCGFNNTVNFNKAFKKQKGITPSTLKKNPKILLH